MGARSRPFFMDQHGHYERERTLQRLITASVADAFPTVDVLDVEIHDPEETVRLYIRRPDGVDHELCARITKHVRELCPDHALEVSSPGTEPPLRTVEHMTEAIGGPVRVRPRGAKRSIKGELKSVDSEAVLIVREDGTEVRFLHGDIVRMHVVDPGAGAGGTSAPPPNRVRSRS